VRPRRLEHHRYCGPQQYFLTICTFQRVHHFIDGTLVADVHERFLSTAVEKEFAILAYCYMPDHLHLLVEGLSNTANLRSFASLAKQHSACATRHRVALRLWQKGYFERVLRDGDDPFNVARYVVQNPVRAGLVRSPEDYPFTGSTILTKKQLIERTTKNTKDRRSRKKIFVVYSTLDSGDSAGPEITSPLVLNRDPWHGQSHVRSASFQATMQAMWVHVAERRVVLPCSSR
jgi:putative transposase